MTDLRQGIDMKTYMGLYTAIHNFCTADDSGKEIRNSDRTKKSHHFKEILYNYLTEYLKIHVGKIYRQSTEYTDMALLSFYIKEWNRYSTAAPYTNHLFRFLNRRFVHGQIHSGKKNIYDIYTLHLVQWREEILMSTQKSIVEIVLRLVEKQRNGETIDVKQLRSVFDSFVSLNINASSSTEAELPLYEDLLQMPLLVATAEYYRKESTSFLADADNSIGDYMKKAEARLDEEKERASLYLINKTIGPLTKTCEIVLIADHSQDIRKEFEFLLDQGRICDLTRMHRLLSRIPQGIDPLWNRFENYVREVGLSAIEKIATHDLKPELYIESLVDVYTQYKDLVDKAFAGASEFLCSMDNACRGFFNCNKVCRPGSATTAELLVQCLDRYLKRTSTTAGVFEQEDMEKHATQTETVLKYLEDKDVFHKFYWRMLAIRQLTVNSASEFAEISIIAKLKDVCGIEYANKLQRILQDMKTSKDLSTSFKKWKDDTTWYESDGSVGIDATFNVLSTGYTLLNPHPTAFTPPEVIIKASERFDTFYHTRHSGRKLNWIWQLCKGELRANYLKVHGGKTSPIFRVSAYQMAVLLLFNDSETLAYGDIEQATNLERSILNPRILVFLKMKVLTISPKGSPPGPGTTLSLNHGFKTKRLKVNFSLSIKSEQNREVKVTHRKIQEHRKLLMQVRYPFCESVTIQQYVYLLSQ